MKYQKKCPCCGHIITAYTISMNKGLAETFYRFANYSINNGNNGLTKKDMELAGILKSHSQYTNFHNLQYFGIIHNKSENREVWFLTKKGEAFFYGEISLLNPVAVMENVSLEDNHEAWRTHKGKRIDINIRSILPFEYKRRPDYQAEKSRQTTLM